MNKEKIKQIEKITCFGLAYCCGLNKECPARDKAIKELGLTKKEFIGLKNNFRKELIKLVLKKRHGKAV